MHASNIQISVYKTHFHSAEFGKLSLKETVVIPNEIKDLKIKVDDWMCAPHRSGGIALKFVDEAKSLEEKGFTVTQLQELLRKEIKKNGKTDRYQNLKKLMPIYFPRIYLAQGRSRTKEDVSAYWPILEFDIDDQPDVFDSIAQFAWVWSIKRSVSGIGFSVTVITDTVENEEDQKAYYRWAAQEFADAGIVVDTLTDSTRGRYVAWSDDDYINEDALIVENRIDIEHQSSGSADIALIHEDMREPDILKLIAVQHSNGMPESFVRHMLLSIPANYYKNSVSLNDNYEKHIDRLLDKFYTIGSVYADQYAQAIKKEKVSVSKTRKHDTVQLPVIYVRSANQRVESGDQEPETKHLAGSLFTTSGDVKMIFGDSGSGKSIVAVELAQSLASGDNILEFLENTSSPKKVLYLDVEMSDRQFADRYTIESFIKTGKKTKVKKSLRKFSENLFTATVQYENINDEDANNTAAWEELYKAIESGRFEAILIDNLTFFTNDQESSQTSKALMKKLKKLARVFSVQVYLVAHTPKRDNARMLSLDDIAGSKNFANFLDEVIAVNASLAMPGCSYIKQMKTRSRAGIEYGFDNVITVTIDETQHELQFVGFESEKKHLQEVTDKDSRNEEIIELAKDENISVKDIAEQFGISRQQVHTIIKRSEKKK